MSIRNVAPPVSPRAHVPTVGLLQGSALYIAAVLGTGILVLPALAAAKAGPASVLAVLAVLLLSIPLAGTFAALAARYPDAGGVATFVRLALGPTAARMAGYWFFFGVTVGIPVVARARRLLHRRDLRRTALGGGDRRTVDSRAAVHLEHLRPARLRSCATLAHRRPGRDRRGSRGRSPRPASRPENFTPFLPHGWGGVGAAVSLFVWAFAGWEAVTHIAGEFKNPQAHHPAGHGHRDRRRRHRLPRAAAGHGRRARHDRRRQPGAAARPRRDHRAGHRTGIRRGRRHRGRRWACSTPTSARSPSSGPPSVVTATCRAGSRPAPRPAASRGAAWPSWPSWRWSTSPR